MRKVFCLSCIVLSILLFTACTNTVAPKAETTCTPAKTLNESPTPEPLPTPEAFPHYEGSSLVGTEEPKPIFVSCEIEENQTLLDAKGVIVKTQKFENDEYFGPMIWLSIENTNDEEIILISEYVNINGIMMPGDLMGSVDAKSTADAFISFMNDPFAAYGIDTIADIQVVFALLSSETFDPYFTSDVINIKTSLSDAYEQSYDSAGDIVFEDNNFKVVYQGLSDTRGYDPTLHFYIENNYHKSVAISTNEFYLNDGKCEYSPLLWCDMLPNTKAYATVTLVTIEMNQLDAGELENMAFYLEVIEPRTYESYLEIGPIVINMKPDQPATGGGSL